MLNKRQKDTYEFIKEFFYTNTYMPTLDQVAKGIGIKSKGATSRHIIALEEAGLIERVPNTHRNIRLTERALNESYSVPLLGKIAAGKPIEAVEDADPVNLVSLFAGPGRFALQVVGDSMIEDGIFDGDMVICETQAEYTEADTIAAMIDGEATLKNFRSLDDDKLLLIPANSEMAPVIHKKKDVMIRGKYVGLLRFNKNR